jgi:hypothetical protein
VPIEAVEADNITLWLTRLRLTERVDGYTSGGALGAGSLRELRQGRVDLLHQLVRALTSAPTRALSK